MPQEGKHTRTRLIVACSVGMLIAILVTIRIWLPSLSLLDQLSQFSPLVRTAIIVKILSPLLSFLLAAGWVWVFLLIGELWLSLRKNDHSTKSIRPMQETTQKPRYKLERRMTAHQSPHKEWETRRPIAAPPLFQQDPTNPWQQAHLPITPLPMTNPLWSPPDASEKSKNGADGEEREEEKAIEAEQILQSPVVDVPLQPQELEKIIPAEGSKTFFSLQKSREPTDFSKPVTLTLLKHIRCWVCADDGTSIEVKLRRGENAIRLIQLAYIAWKQGASVDRDKMLTYVLARGKRREMNTDQLGEVFDAAKRYLRQDLDRAIKELAKNGHQVTTDVDFFSNEPGFYWLHPSCRVIDLEKIDDLYHAIQIARKEGVLDEKLNGTIPEWVIEACQNLIGAYPGDFLQSFLEKFPEEFGAWVKEPVTLYRDKYLDALLIMANYESALGKSFLDPNLSVEQNEEHRRHHIGRAAQLFHDYAMYAVNTRWDQKLKFAYRAGKDGERVVRAARAMRRCVVELGKLGNPDMIDQVYLAFKERMATLSEGNWKPDRDTESDVIEAKRTTSAYRFSSQIPSRQDEHV
ncbi:hypothetical protein [Tengunoibacter tsumagoiensis]|uniref:Uncharacterized protein n=1 Tax=Tengunoibacter tsumagoiensis TaxID=2014871 RepID=A0A402A7B4_9CHLR|nr:hypothetical protein [Tengunoibacter tsumagoiensis]GCE15047.1 hypothetical protein KTT_49060 [Tengunoibacter tsumagoiensis]